MMHAGGGSFKHTKHFDLRLMHILIQEMIQDYAVEVQHLGTEEMPEVHLSKATTGRKFEKCMEALMGRPEKLYDGAAIATYAGIYGTCTRSKRWEGVLTYGRTKKIAEKKH